MVITLKPNHTIIGWAKFAMSPDDISRGEIGYWIGEQFQGQGIAFEAVSALIVAAFQQFGIQTVEAAAQLGNVASHALLEKLGMKRKGERMVFAPARQQQELCGIWERDRGQTQRTMRIGCLLVSVVVAMRPASRLERGK